MSNVSFTDYDLVKIEKQADGDWLLTSLTPFTSEETLTIEMNDGVKFEIEVTDSATCSDLYNFVVDVQIDAPQTAEGHYEVVAGDSYSIIMAFEEGAAYQFPDDGSSMTYTIPSGLNAADGHEGTFTINVIDESTSEVFPVKGNTYNIRNGVLTANFNTNDPNYNKLTASAAARFELEFEGSFDESADIIKFSDSIEKDIDVTTSSSVEASKTASVDINNDEVTYTVTIESHGHSTNVVVKDTITDDRGVLSLDASSISAISSTGNPVSMTGSASGNSFEYTIAAMRDGETIAFTYKARIDSGKIPNIDGKYIQTGINSVEVKSDENPEPETVNVNTTIDYTPDITKGNAVVGEDGKTLTWTITANEQMKVSMANGTITDTIDPNSQGIMTCSGSGIIVQVYDKNGLVRTYDVGWDSLTQKTDETWTYTIPGSDAEHAYKYVITYTTVVDTSSLVTDVTVNNEVHTDGDKSGHGSGQVGPGQRVEVQKDVQKVDIEHKEITWTVSFNIL